MRHVEVLRETRNPGSKARVRKILLRRAKYVEFFTFLSEARSAKCIPRDKADSSLQTLEDVKDRHVTLCLPTKTQPRDNYKR